MMMSVKMIDYLLDYPDFQKLAKMIGLEFAMEWVEHMIQSQIRNTELIDAFIDLKFVVNRQRFRMVMLTSDWFKYK